MGSQLLKDKKMKILFLIILAGLDLAIFISKISRLIGVAILAFGLVLFVYLSAQEQGKGFMEYIQARFQTTPGPLETAAQEGKQLAGTSAQGELPDPLASKIIDFFTTGHLENFFPVMGVLVIAAVAVFNIAIKKELDFGGNDIVMLLLGAILLGYHHIPKSYKREKDFAIIFFTLLCVIVVIPTTLYNYQYGTTEGDWDDEEVPNSQIVDVFLARPVSKLVDITGVYSYNEGIAIFYEKNYDYSDDDDPRALGRVSIALGCTGLYSVSIFLSGFTAFILVEYHQFDQKVGILLGLGILSSYIANLLRMAIIVLVGSYYGTDALLWTHENLGEFIFLIWIAIFWSFMFNYLFEEQGVGQESETEKEETVEKEVMEQPPVQSGISGQNQSKEEDGERLVLQGLKGVIVTEEVAEKEEKENVSQDGTGGGQEAVVPKKEEPPAQPL